MRRFISWLLRRIESIEERRLADRLADAEDRLRATRVELQVARDERDALKEQVRFVETCREAELKAVHSMIQVHGAAAAQFRQ